MSKEDIKDEEKKADEAKAKGEKADDAQEVKLDDDTQDAVADAVAEAVADAMADSGAHSETAAFVDAQELDFIKPSAVIAEFLGTFLLAGAVIKLASTAPAILGTVGIALILTILIVIFGGMSGAHLNPAISIALWINKKIHAKRAIIYIIAQLLGAAAALGVFYAIYKGTYDANLTNALINQGITQSAITKAGGATKYITQMVASSQGQYTVDSVLKQLGIGSFISTGLAKGSSVVLMTLLQETLGSIVFGLGIGHAVYAEDKNMVETGLSVGFGLLGGATLFGAVMNPAVALAIGAFNHASINPYLIYILGAVIGMTIGITAYRVLRERTLAAY